MHLDDLNLSMQSILGKSIHECIDIAAQFPRTTVSGGEPPILRTPLPVSKAILR